MAGFKRISQSNRIYSVILKAISQSPKVIGDYIKKYEDVDGNSVILSEGGFENSFYYAFTSFFDKFVTKVSKDNDFLNKQDNYIEMMKVELGDFFVKVHELIVVSTKTEIKLYLESIFKSIVENLYELLETEEPEHNFIFKTDYEKFRINFKIPKELTTLPIKYLPTKENNFSFLSTIVFYKDGKIGEEDFRRIANQFLDNKDNFLQYFKNLISERLESLYSYGPYYIRNLSNDLLLEDELEEIVLLYKFILELFEAKEDPELIEELNFAKEYLKEILS